MTKHYVLVSYAYIAEWGIPENLWSNEYTSMPKRASLLLLQIYVFK